jgi:hypothetical protein
MLLKFRIFLFSLLVCLSLVPMAGKAQGPANASNYTGGFTSRDLKGTWYLAMSNLSKWKRLNKTSVVLTFAVSAKDTGRTDNPVMESVEFLKSGKPVSQKAVLYVKGNKEFRKHLKGGLQVSGRHEYVVALDPGKQWLVIYVKGNLFRKDAIEVLSRTSHPDQAFSTQISKLFEENYFLHAKTKKIRVIPQK